MTAPRLWNVQQDSLRLIDSLELHIFLRQHLYTTYRVFYNEFILTVVIVLQFNFLLLFYFTYLLMIRLAYELGLLEALFNYLFVII